MLIRILAGGRAGGVGSVVHVNVNGRMTDIPVDQVYDATSDIVQILRDGNITFAYGTDLNLYTPPLISSSDVTNALGYAPAKATGLSERALSITDFVGPAATEIAPALVAAHAALPAQGGRILIPAGQFPLNTAVTFTKPVDLVGVSKLSSAISVGSATADMVTFAGGGSVSGLTVNAGVTRTAGAYFAFDPGAGNISYGVRVSELNLNGYYVGIDLRRTSDAGVSGCEMVGAAGSSAGVLLRNLTHEDSGDHFIRDCYFGGLTGAGGVGVLQQSSGGLRLINNKFNGLVRGYAMELNTSTGTSILLVTGNSFENQTDCGIDIKRASGTGIFTYGSIIGNEFAYTPTPIRVRDTGSVFYDFIISGNLLGLPANAIGMDINGGSTFVIGTNTFDAVNSPATAIAIGSNTQNIQIQPQAYRNITTRIADSGTSTTILKKTVTVTGSGTTTTASGAMYYADVAVTFPTGAFAAAPNVTVSCAAPGLFGSTTGAITTTGCTVRVYAATNGAVVPFTVAAMGV